MCNLLSAICCPQSAVCNLRSAVCSPQCATRNPQSAVRSPQSEVHSPQSVVRSPQSSVCRPPSADRSFPFTLSARDNYIIRCWYSWYTFWKRVWLACTFILISLVENLSYLFFALLYETKLIVRQVEKFYKWVCLVFRMDITNFMYNLKEKLSFVFQETWNFTGCQCVLIINLDSFNLFYTTAITLNLYFFILIMQ